MSTGGTLERWRPAEVGIALIIGSAVAAVLWSLTAVVLLGWSSDETCQSRMDPPSGRKAQAFVQWFPLKSMCSAGDDTLSLTSPVVTILWTIAAAALIGAAVVGVGLLIYSAIVQAGRITRRLR